MTSTEATAATAPAAPSGPGVTAVPVTAVPVPEAPAASGVPGRIGLPTASALYIAAVLGTGILVLPVLGVERVEDVVHLAEHVGAVARAHQRLGRGRGALPLHDGAAAGFRRFTESADTRH